MRKCPWGAPRRPLFPEPRALCPAFPAPAAQSVAAACPFVEQHHLSSSGGPTLDYHPCHLQPVRAQVPGRPGSSWPWQSGFTRPPPSLGVFISEQAPRALPTPLGPARPVSPHPSQAAGPVQGSVTGAWGQRARVGGAGGSGILAFIEPAVHKVLHSHRSVLTSSSPLRWVF